MGRSDRAPEPGMTTVEDFLARGLWECMRLSGADLSGYDGFGHWSRMRQFAGMVYDAVEAVKQLRADYDES